MAVHADRISELTDPATGKPFTDKEIRDDLFAFLFAGHDTTATTLTYSLWQLGRNPGIQERVAPEAVDLGDRPLRANDIEHLPCTVQVIHESLRMCPPGATTGRMAMQDVEVDGYRIPAGTNTVVGIYALHRDPALWDEPEKFDPERFAPGRPGNRLRRQYLPFGGGPRTCIGDRFAMLEATLGLASIVRKLCVQSLHDECPVKTPFTSVAAEPVPARVEGSAVAA
ncbi:cytochrome P450 [Rhodococcus gordoniae]|uniref:cytochrome P450 n=1 Tax=Rhodococcus gordoniae TaxID=223392 RepID=UPI0020CB70FA|nr:cytochrome P450 [Rhodococcus gordoniae]UTT50523.1 cytochrome P450 [Rhodococcus gordoniae]